MKASFRNVFLLGTLGMGSMMVGMTSCSDDEKNNQGGGGDTPTSKVSISLSKKSDTLALCDVMQLTATILPNDAEQGVIWSTNLNDETQVKVEDGKVTIPEGTGVANRSTILVIAQSKADTNKKDTCIILVNTHKKKVEALGSRSGKKTYAVQLWKDGPWWAEFNVGATIESYRGQNVLSVDKGAKISEAGDTAQLHRTTGNYFCWGGLVPYIDGNKKGKGGDNPADDPAKDVSTLPDNRDIARLDWGSNWKIPDTLHLKNLINNSKGDPVVDGNFTTITFCDGSTNQFDGSSIKGLCFKGKNEYANDSIFFPTVGSCDYSSDYDCSFFDSSVNFGEEYSLSCWSSTRKIGTPKGSYALIHKVNGGNKELKVAKISSSYEGYSVRAVYAK